MAITTISSAVPVVVNPDPQRITEGLRDTGYEFRTAVADIIDNSIAAGASLVDVRLAIDFAGDILVSVIDNGCGMDEKGLKNAMRYGSDKRPDAASLGKFGLGLKTASTAFCRRLSVIARAKGTDTRKACWDLDHIRDTGSWELLVGPPSPDEQRLLESIAGSGAGTLVVWEKVDRLLQEYAKPDGKAAKNALKRREDDLRFHVSMVYQRFVDPADTRARNVTIRINGTDVQPWDPYCVAETIRPVAEKSMKVAIGDGGQAAEFLVRAFVLPRKDEFSDLERRKEAQVTNEMQGIYVYRENRLIHGPDWLDMFRKEPHLSLCRIELSFDHRLDDAFKVDIKKSRILLDETLYDWMRDKFLPGPRKEAELRYRKGMAATVTGTAALLHTGSNNAIHAKAENLKTASVDNVDGKSGDVTISNKHGTTRLKIKLVEQKQSGELHVQPSDSLLDGVLWEPAFIDNNQAVRINTTHPYYHKVYLPNRQSGVTIQGLDSLIWALCAAELGNVSEQNKRNFEEMRYEVSRILRRLVEDLPDPESDENGAE